MVHPDVAVETPVPILMNCLIQGCVSHRGSLEEFQEPVGCGHDHIVVIAIVVGCCIDLLDPRDLIGPMLLKEPRNVTIWELLDPVSGLPHPILNGYGKAWAATVMVEYIPLWAFFSGEGVAIIDKVCTKEFKLFFLGVALPGPLFAILFVLALMLLEGADEAVGNVGNSVEVISDLDGSCHCAG
jgi:hypothetical protein